MLKMNRLTARAGRSATLAAATLAVWCTGIASTNAQDPIVIFAPSAGAVCVGTTFNAGDIQVGTLCEYSTPPVVTMYHASQGSTEIQTSEYGDHSPWIEYRSVGEPIILDEAGVYSFTAGDACGEYTPDAVIVVAVEFEQLHVDGASGTNWVAVRTPSPDYVVVTAELNPDDVGDDFKDLIYWTPQWLTDFGPGVRGVSKGDSAHTTVTADLCGSDSVDVWIIWASCTEFRTSAPKNDDSSVAPDVWGISDTLQNGMLMQWTLSPPGVGALGGIAYDIKRTRESGAWSKSSGGVWQQFDYDPPGTNDDNGNDDEDRSPSASDHIYVVDTPGFGSDIAFAAELAVKASFVEWVNVDFGSGSLACSDDYPWHSIVWFQNNGGAWQRKTGANDIGPNSTQVGTSSPPSYP